MSTPTDAEYELLKRAVAALETIALAIDKDAGILRMKDVDRAKVYSEHLGEKLRRL